MGRISVEYKKKPTPLEALKMDMSLEILDHNIEKIPGDVIFHKNNKYSELQSYVIYAACKHQDQVIAIISLIDYDVKSKKVYIKIMDDTSGPYYGYIYILTWYPGSYWNSLSFVSNNRYNQR
jgi:hypothetical protein